jgi:hypothetical protein
MLYSEIRTLTTTALNQLATDSSALVEEAFSCTPETARDILGECRIAYVQGTQSQPIYDWLSPHTVESLATYLASDARFTEVDRDAVAAFMFDAWNTGQPTT